MPHKSPDHHDAELLLKVYDLRREAVMRQSRDAIISKFWPKSFEDLQAVTAADHPLNAAYRQTTTYWEMVYGIARHGIVNPDYWIESNGEGLYIFARVAPFLPQFRATYPRAFRNAEWMSTSCETARAVFALFQDRVRTVLSK